jgi:uncharacterized membrane protein
LQIIQLIDVYQSALLSQIFLRQIKVMNVYFCVHLLRKCMPIIRLDHVFRIVQGEISILLPIKQQDFVLENVLEIPIWKILQELVS